MFERDSINGSLVSILPENRGRTATFKTAGWPDSGRHDGGSAPHDGLGDDQIGDAPSQVDDLRLDSFEVRQDGHDDISRRVFGETRRPV